MDIDRELWKRVGIRAAIENITKKELVETALKEYLQRKEVHVAMEKYSKCRLGKAEITVKGVFEDDYSKLTFFHPLTGQECEYVEQTLYGWSDSEGQEEWEQLVEAIQEDDMLEQKVYDDIEVIEY